MDTKEKVWVETDKDGIEHIYETRNLGRLVRVTSQEITRWEQVNAGYKADSPKYTGWEYHVHLHAFEELFLASILIFFLGWYLVGSSEWLFLFLVPFGICMWLLGRISDRYYAKTDELQKKYFASIRDQKSKILEHYNIEENNTNIRIYELDGQHYLLILHTKK